MKRPVFLVSTMLSAVMFSFFAAAPATAQTFSESIVYSLCSTEGSTCTDGNQPEAAVIQGSDGNFYGTTAGNGSSGAGFGTVFRLTPGGGFTVLHTFSEVPNSGVYDGFYPDAPLTEGTDGNFYGTTSSGGANENGVIFRVTSKGAYTILYNFCSDPNSDDSDCLDGGAPNGGLVQGTDGNFYGTTSEGGTYEQNNSFHGVIFQLTPTGKYSVLHSFSGTDGGGPMGQLLQGTDGDFYGTTFVLGANRSGTIFKITPSGTFTLLLSLDMNVNGAEPKAGLVQGADGNLYGTTSNGGPNSGAGTAFSMTLGGALEVLHTFGSSSTDSGAPSGLVEGSDSNFYGTGATGGTDFGSGSAYKMTPGGSTTLIYSFGTNYDGFDGQLPEASLVQGSDGNFYGTTLNGGPGPGGGTVYKLTPSSALAAPVKLTAPSNVAAGASFAISYEIINSFAGKLPGTLNYCFATNTAGDTTHWTGILTGLPTVQKKTITAPDSSGIYTYALTCGGTESGFATVTVTSNKKNSETVLTASPNPATVGASVTLQAAVTGPVATPTGKVSYAVEGMAIGSGSLNGSGESNLTASTNGIPPGSYPLVATYTGNSTYNSSASTAITVKLNKAPTATTLTATPASVTPPGSVTLTAMVKRSTSGANGTPTGSVTFSTEGTTLATIQLNNQGVAALTAPSSGYPEGSYPIKAIYSGDSSDVSSTSPAVTVTVK